MTRALVSLIGSDIRFSGHGLDEKRAPEGRATVLLRGWSERYDRAAARDDESELLSIGREMFAWLDNAGFGSAWARGAGDRELEIAVSGAGDAAVEAALLDAPWELLATDHGQLAADDLQPFVTWRRVGPEGQPASPAFRELRLMFMAAAPEGQVELDFEAEEAANLAATAGGDRVQLVVEETGALEFLCGRLASEEGPFEALHLSCHGDIDKDRGPILLLETAEGGETRATAGDLIGALPAQGRPLLVALSACRTAEIGRAGGAGRALRDGPLRRDAGGGRIEGGSS